jgi:hypothetical protein
VYYKRAAEEWRKMRRHTSPEGGRSIVGAKYM